jgi:hypothetical protein
MAPKASLWDRPSSLITLAALGYARSSRAPWAKGLPSGPRFSLKHLMNSFVLNDFELALLYQLKHQNHLMEYRSLTFRGKELARLLYNSSLLDKTYTFMV